MSFFLLKADVAYEDGASDLSAIWGIIFTNWEHAFSYLDYFICWAVFHDSIGEDTSKFILVSLFPEVGIMALE